MKKIIASSAAVCILFTGILSFLQIKAKSSPDSLPENTTYEEAYIEALKAVPEIDYAAMFGKYDTNETVMTVDGHEISWEEYYHFLFDYTSEIRDYMVSMVMYYGECPSWEDEYDSVSGQRFCDLPAVYAVEDLKQYAAIIGYAEENGIALNEDSINTVKALVDEARINQCGQDATEEDFDALLKESYMTRQIYEDLIKNSCLYQQMFSDIYGQNGEKVSIEDAVGYLEDNGYISANHILFMTMDRSTGETADEDDARSKQETADRISRELRSEEDDARRLELFLKYKEEFDEDTGKEIYPNGYTYTSGTMVPEFESAASELKEYEVSCPVKSVYGYHIIMRMPLSGEEVIEVSDSGMPVTAKIKFANEEYGRKLQEYLDNIQVEYTKEFESPSILDYIAVN